MVWKTKAIWVFIFILGLVAGSLGTSAVLAQNSGDDNNIIYAAYQKINGQLRIISDPSEANKSEVVISWNKQGPKGDQGLQGPPGSGADVTSLLARIDALETQVTELQEQVDFLSTGPTLSINDVSLLEGDLGDGDKYFDFVVTLSRPSISLITFTFTTEDGTAIDGVPSIEYLTNPPGRDYIPSTGQGTIQPGQTEVFFTIRILGDATQEPNETFYVNISNPVNATIGDGQGLGTILNDD